MTPILVRPVREQLEHDRVIRLLQARWRRKYLVTVNQGNEQTASVTSGDSTCYPDLVLASLDRGHKPEIIVEVETAESVNNLEALAAVGADGPAPGGFPSVRPHRLGGFGPAAVHRAQHPSGGDLNVPPGGRPDAVHDRVQGAPSTPRDGAAGRTPDPGEAEANVGQRGRADGKRAAQGREDRRSRAAAGGGKDVGEAGPEAKTLVLAASGWGWGRLVHRADPATRTRPGPDGNHPSRV